MRPTVARELARRFRAQHGVISRSQLYAIGVNDSTVRHRLALGEWERVGPRVVRLAASDQSPEQGLMGLCLAAGASAVASHRSAAWLWGFARPPARYAITVPRTLSSRTLAGEVHRPTDFPAQVATHRHIPCTTAHRTMVDVAAVARPEELEEMLDKALAARVVSVEGLQVELGRLGRRGREGVAALRWALSWSGPSSSAQPSVLESMTLRLLGRAGLRPLAVEVKTGSDLNYRLDILLRPDLAVEVDGYSYHQGAEQMTEDARRRNRLFLSGVRLLVYTWRDIAYDGHRVIAEVRNALHHESRDKGEKTGGSG